MSTTLKKKFNTNINKKDCIYLYNRILRLIKRSNCNFFRFKKLKGAMGYCEWEDGIVLDYRRELIPTLIHECVHYLYSDWPESRVLYVEKRIVNTITPSQILHLLQLFAQKVTVEDDANLEYIQQ